MKVDLEMRRGIEMLSSNGSLGSAEEVKGQKVAGAVSTSSGVSQVASEA